MFATTFSYWDNACLIEANSYEHHLFLSVLIVPTRRRKWSAACCPHLLAATIRLSLFSVSFPLRLYLYESTTVVSTEELQKKLWCCHSAFGHKGEL